MIGRQFTCRLGACFEEGFDQVKSVLTVSIQTELTPETKDTSFPHKASILSNKCNHGTNFLRAVTVQTSPQNKTHHTATVRKVGVCTGLDRIFIILCLTTTKKLLWKHFPSLCIKKRINPPKPNQDQNQPQVFLKAVLTPLFPALVWLAQRSVGSSYTRM